MKTDIETVASFVVRQLPDSIRERQELLGALFRLMPKQSRGRKEVFGMLTILERHLQLQGEFAFEANTERDGQ